MSVVPIGCANDTTAMYEENSTMLYGDLATTSTLLSFPDPIVKGTKQYYQIKSGNPLRAGQIDRYNVSVSILIGITTPETGNGLFVVAVGGIPYTYSTGSGTNPGNGDPGAPPNPTSAKASAATIGMTESTYEIDITGSCLVDAANGLRVGIFFGGTSTTAVLTLNNILYNYTYAGPQ